MQSSFGARLVRREAGREGRREVGRRGVGRGWGGERTRGTRMFADGWEVGNKSGAVQWCSAIWWEAHFSCVARPHTGWVIRATHLAPLPPESGRGREKLEEEGTPQLLIVVMISEGIAQVFVDELFPYRLFPSIFISFLSFHSPLPSLFRSFFI